MQAKSYQKVQDESSAAQERRNDSALRIAITGAQMADLLVQRTKDDDFTIQEAASLARAIRGTSVTLAADLTDTKELLKSWRFSAKFTQSNETSKQRDETSGSHKESED